MSQSTSNTNVFSQNFDDLLASVVVTPENHTNDYRVDTDIFGESPFKDTVEPEPKPESKPEPETKPEPEPKQKRSQRKTKAQAPVTNGKLTVEVEVNDKVLTLLGEERIQDVQNAAQEFINKTIKEMAQKAFDDLW